MTYIVILLVIIAIAFGWVVFFGAPFIPSRRDDTKKAFSKLYKLKKTDTLVDLGSGDGRILRWSSSMGAMSIGYEINPLLVFISKCATIGNDKVRTILADLWKVSLPRDVTVVYAFSVSRDIQRLTEFLQSESNRITRSFYVITYGFELLDLQYEKRTSSHFLYKIQPLQSDQA